MEITKILKIESAIHLLKLLENKNEILDTADEQVYYILNYYIDCANEYLYGCKCEEEINYEKMINEYENSIRQKNVYDHLLSSFRCDRIDFN